MGTSSSIATGLLDGYARGLQINAFRDRERQRSEAASLEIDAGRDDAAKRDRLAAAEEKRISRERDIYDQTGADLPPGESIAVPAARTEPARRQAESGPVAAEPTVQTNPQAEPSRPPNYNPLAPMSAIPPENRRSFIDRRYEAKAKILQDYYSEIDRPDLALAVPGIMSKLRDSEIEEKGRGALLAMATGDPGGVAAFAKVYQLYDDGKAIDPKSGTFDQATQTWKGIRVIDEATGKEVGTRDLTQNQIFAFAANLSAADIAKNNIERMQKIQDTVLASRLKMEEERNKVHLIGPRTVAMRGDGQPLGTNAMYSRDYDSDGSGSGGGGGGGGGGGSGRGSKAKSPLEQAKGIYWDSIGKADGSPEFAIRSTDGERLLEVLYEDLARENANRRPGEEVTLNPGTAASIVNRALNNPNAITYQIDKNTGMPIKVFSDKEVNGGKRYSLATNLPVEDMEKSVGSSGMKTAVEQMIDSIVSQAPNEQQAQALRGQMIQAASNPKERERYLAAVRSAGGDVVAASRQLDLVSRYFVAQNGGGGGDGFFGRLAGALGLSAPPQYSGMGSAFPQEARSRFEADNAKANPVTAKATQKPADRDAERKRLRGELGEISIRTVSYLTPEKARELHDKYRDVLTGPERSMLADKIADARYLRRD